MGYKCLKRKTSFQVNPNSQPDLDAYTYLIERQLKPEARKDVHLLHALEIKPTSMIDISMDYLQRLCIYVNSQA
jgi:thiamine-monophosphate kinase